MRRFIALLSAIGIAGCAHPPSATGLAVLSGGAVEPGLHAALELYEKEAGGRVAVTYATTPQIRGRIETKGEKFDVVIVPPATMEAFARAGRVSPERTLLGSVGQGIAVRPGAPLPDISSVEALKRALREADSVVFNRATGGQYVEGMLKKIGVYGEIESRTTRYASAGEVMDHLLGGRGREIGFAPIPEIMLYAKRGLRFVGPLPAEVQQRSAYVASPMSGARAGARDLVRFLGTPAAKAALAAGGVD
jgi:molybdate transport system substrate-binding protein